MRELRLDHHRAPVARRGWQLFVAASLLSLLVAHDYVTASIGLEKVNVRRMPANSAAARADADRLRQELQEANRVIGELALPWHALFDAIEQARSDQTALLSAQPEPRQQVILLSGEARNYEAMLAFARQLENSGVLNGVHVQNHEIRQQDGQRPVFFTLSARWGARP